MSTKQRSTRTDNSRCDGGNCQHLATLPFSHPNRMWNAALGWKGVSQVRGGPIAAQTRLDRVRKHQAGKDMYGGSVS
jgi:hypothetical protein